MPTVVCKPASFIMHLISSGTRISIAFHGALWHGAYPRSTPGLRVTIANYYRHVCVQPQDDIPNHFPKDLADDCDNPALFKHLAGFGSPYQNQALPLPKAVTA